MFQEVKDIAKESDDGQGKIHIHPLWSLHLYNRLL